MASVPSAVAWRRQSACSCAVTAVQFNTKLGVVWQLPVDAEPGERDSLYLVILDQRGGTSFGQITVQYR